MTTHENQNILQSAALTQSQLMIWTGQQLSPDKPLYNMAFSFEFQDNIQVVDFQQAFQQLVEETAVLRTIIFLEDANPKQVVRSKMIYELEVLDWTNKGRSLVDKDLEERSQVMLDLSACLFDSALIQLAPNHWIWYINQHHLITDGWSVVLLYNKMVDLYGKKNNIVLNPFHNYISQEQVQRSTANVTSEYWLQKSKETMNLPRLYGAISDKNKKSASQRIYIDLGTTRTQRLKALTQENDLRAWTVDLAMYNILSTVLFAFLYRVSGQRKLTIGSPAHNRSTADFKSTLGLFMEMFPLQTTIEEGDRFMDLFDRVRVEVFDFLKYAQSGASSPEGNHQFNVIFNYINASFEDFNETRTSSKWIHPNHHDPAHLIRLTVHDLDNSGNIQLLFDINEELSDCTDIEYIPHHFLTLLDAFIEDRAQSITANSIISEGEFTEIISAFNQTKKQYTKRSTLMECFELQVQKTPDVEALVFENEQLSYIQFNKKANQIAHYLQSQHIGKEQVVAVVMERSMEMLLAIYGILKAGAAYLPIDPHNPTERINFMLQDAKVPMVLTQERFLRNLQSSGKRYLSVDSNWHLFENQATHNLEKVDKKTLAYIIYTSGSTGQPKGVMVNHDSICNRLHWGQDNYQMTGEDKVIHKTPFTFDVSIWELFWPLQVGASLIIAKPEGHKDSAYLINTVVEHGITHMHFVPSMLTVFLEDKNCEKCTSLQHVFCSGEAVPITLQRQFFERFRAKLYNLYGPTEASVEVTHWTCERDTKDQVVPMGRPTANTSMYILNEKLHPVPVGVPGELYIGGIQVARGYLNRPALTKERFVPNIFNTEGSDTMYRTGDLARYRKNGVIEYLGRIDTQIKLRGFRIELAEIETTLSSFNTIQQAVVVTKGEGIELVIVAYYTAKESFEKASLITYLKKHLPVYMIPSHFEKVDSFELTSSGKVDRKRLPLIDSNISFKQNEVAFVLPRNPFEEMLLEIWQTVLKIEKISVLDNLIDLGGHSLNAIQIMVRVNEAFELEMPLQTIFEYPVLADYATHISETIELLLEELED